MADGRIANAYTLEGAGANGVPAPERFLPFKVPAHKEGRILLYDPADILYRNSYTLQLDDPPQTPIPLSKQFEKEL